MTLTSKGQVLRTVVAESLSAFPEDAHVRLFQFLSNSGASEAEQKELQQAWTRVVMAGEAFGRKKGGPVNPAQFSEDLLKELCAGNKEVTKLEDMLGSFRAVLASQEKGDEEPIENLHDLKKSTGVLSSLQSMTKVGANLSDAQQSIYPDRGVVGQCTEGSVESEGAIFLHRRTCRGVRFTFHNRKPGGASPMYSPLRIRDFGSAVVMYGEAIHRNTTDNTARPTQTPIIGVRVSSNQAIMQDRGWASYQCLHELIAMGPDRVRLFPTPLGTMESEAHPGVTYVFDLSNCRPLKQFMGPALSTFMRKYPSVVLSWSAQIGASARAFQCLVSGRLLRLPVINDVFVAENGQLMVGNTVFEPVEEHLEEGGTAAAPELDISDFFNNLLASVLSLSRTIKVNLAPSLFNADSTQAGESFTQAGEDDEGAIGESKRVDAKEEVVAVVEGCELKLVFGGHSSRGVQVINTFGGQSEKTMNKSNLQVHVHGDSSVVTAEGSAWDDRQTSVTIQAKGPGSSLLRVVSSSMHPTLTGSSNYLALDVRIVVVPAYPIMSVELAELVSQLECSHMSGNNNMFLSAECVRTRDIEATMKRYDEVTVADDWAAVRSSLDQTQLSSGSTR